MIIVIGIQGGLLQHTRLSNEEDKKRHINEVLEKCDNPDYDSVYTLVVENGEVDYTFEGPFEEESE